MYYYGCMKIKSYLLKKHKKDCAALEMFKVRTWSSPFVLGKHAWINLPHKSGRSSQKSVLLFRCNDSLCPSEMAVIENDVLELIDHSGLDQVERGETGRWLKRDSDDLSQS